MCHTLLAGLVNYYRNILRKCAYTISPLNRIPTTVKLEWTDVEHNAFTEMEKIVGQGVFLLYLDFSERFIIHADTSNIQIELVINGKCESIAFYLKFLTPVY